MKIFPYMPMVYVTKRMCDPLYTSYCLSICHSMVLFVTGLLSVVLYRICFNWRHLLKKSKHLIRESKAVFMDISDSIHYLHSLQGCAFPHKAMLSYLYFHHLVGKSAAQASFTELCPLHVPLGEYKVQQQKLRLISRNLWCHASVYTSVNSSPRYGLLEYNY